MDGLFSRYRNLSALLLLLAGQLILLAWQIKSNGDTRLIRVWAVTAVTPMARGLEATRDGVGGILARWFMAGALERDNTRLKRETAQLQIRNELLQEQLQQAGRAQALLEFRSQLPSRSLPSRILGSAPGVQSGVFILDRGSSEGVKRGMAVVTGYGIIGQIVASYPTASLMMLASSQGFAAGVISQKHKTQGLVKGEGGTCRVDGIRNEQPLDKDEWFYTSGEDRIFPRGLRVGQARSIKEGVEGKEIEIRPVALDADFAEVLILLDAIHGQIPEPLTPSNPAVQVLSPPPQESNGLAAVPASPVTPSGSPAALNTDADRLREHYKRVVESQGFQVGSTPYRAPDFNRQPAAVPAPTPPAALALPDKQPPALKPPAGKQPPAVKPPAGKQPPAVKPPADKQLPALKPPTGKQAPAVKPPAGKQPPAVKPPAEKQAPALKPPTGKQAPAVKPPAGNQLPAVKPPAEKQAPAVKPPAGKPEPVQAPTGKAAAAPAQLAPKTKPPALDRR
jgi:rod shape-determining protein MreC